VPKALLAGEYEITDALNLMIRDDRSVEYAIHEGWWLDAGKKDDALAANALLLDEHTRQGVRGIVDNFRVEGRVVVEEGAVVRNGVVRALRSSAGRQYREFLHRAIHERR
jgi:glucose-1-phosphate thymidylyltransferase